ncbi:MAG: c-type cytochrome domain-containing protein, partial [Chitinophagaceae bacterium]
MKKLIVVASLFLGVFFLSATVFQCTKTGDIIQNLDRSYTGTPDSSVYASFYESHTVQPSDVTPDVNDVIKYRGVQVILHEYCGTSNCHGGPIKPKFESYTDIMKYVVPGNPGASKLWEYITTNDFNEAMPPVNSNHELNTTDKSIIYNWIVNGARERPTLADFRPAAIRVITNGCGSANCHNQATATGAWARRGLVPGVTPSDTTPYTYINPTTGATTVYTLLSNATLRNQVWNAYKDSVKKFY